MNSESLGKLILRLVLGFTFLLHGVSKLKGGVAPIEGLLQQHGLPGFIAYGAYLGEVVGSILVLLGWYSRIGAVLIAINMVFAISLVHIAQVLTLNEQGGWGIELQAMFLFTGVAIALLGPGRYSINQK